MKKKRIIRKKKKKMKKKKIEEEEEEKKKKKKKKECQSLTKGTKISNKELLLHTLQQKKIENTDID
jgi:hypothetical protein